MGDAVGDAKDVAELLLSELATNVVLHTDCAALAVSICVRPESVRFGVSDCETNHLPEPRDAEDGRPGGFGLRLVEQLASEWGTAVDPFGKSVWFELPRGRVERLPEAVRLEVLDETATTSSATTSWTGDRTARSSPR